MATTIREIRATRRLGLHAVRNRRCRGNADARLSASRHLLGDTARLTDTTGLVCTVLVARSGALLSLCRSLLLLACATPAVAAPRDLPPARSPQDLCEMAIAE